MLHQYQNGNATVTIHGDGTRIVECEGDIKLKFPLNIDIRVSQRCAFGMNQATGKAICGFCHESATTTGADADLGYLFSKLLGLPAGIELAVGVNQVTTELVEFLRKCKAEGWIVNTTINQGHVRRDSAAIKMLIEQELIKGLGISYRKGMLDAPAFITDYQNTVFHVIAGIDTIDEVKHLASIGVKKILVLGEKDFGFNLGKVKITTDTHRAWYRQLHELFAMFDIVSFDNLALEQLNVRRFVKDWDSTYQHEFSFYINAVDKYFSPSSRSPDQTPMLDSTVESYFQQLFPEFQ